MVQFMKENSFLVNPMVEEGSSMQRTNSINKTQMDLIGATI
jgi:hypothetical protein